MFAKSAVFFLALITLVNAAPVIDYTTNPGVRPIKVALPDGKYKILPIGNVALKREPSPTSGTAGTISGADILRLDLDLDTDIAIAPIIRNREIADLDNISNQILNGLKSKGLDKYVDQFSTRIQRLKDLPASDVSPANIEAEANLLVLEYGKVLAGLNVKKPLEARGIVIDSRILAQLQSFVNSTIALLRILGKSGIIERFVAQINRLKVEAQNGTLDVGDLLAAARDIFLSLL